MILDSDPGNLGILGSSAVVKLLRCQIQTAARSDLTVLITGESGTGKELVARAIHHRSDRAEMPFISINCGALTETLLESELFGYERGAFTGAQQKHRGLFEAAHTGTLFLDEIGEMSSSCQVKLLRVLQEHAVRPVGGHSEILVDVRVVAATNRNLAQEISERRFRQDLYYRIAVLTLSVPPLRERISDIPLLVHHFLHLAEKRMKHQPPHSIEQEAIDAFCKYFWPGNVRQLRHVIERLAAIAEDEIITVKDVRHALPSSAVDTMLSGKGTDLQVRFRENDSLDDFLDRAMLSLYEQLRQRTGTHSQTARVLKTDRVSLYQRLERARQRIQRSAFL